ncbi:hypothetical protein F5X99DRAFT_412898 [Biscogniauxia marginata]|nr:hypothetical protein F5X99DRAFT_412898 [Biscogniauxia marginata]
MGIQGSPPLETTYRHNSSRIKDTATANSKAKQIQAESVPHDIVNPHPLLFPPQTPLRLTEIDIELADVAHGSGATSPPFLYILHSYDLHACILSPGPPPPPPGGPGPLVPVDLVEDEDGREDENYAQVADAVAEDAQGRQGGGVRVRPEGGRGGGGSDAAATCEGEKVVVEEEDREENSDSEDREEARPCLRPRWGLRVHRECGLVRPQTAVWVCGFDGILWPWLDILRTWSAG